MKMYKVVGTGIGVEGKKMYVEIAERNVTNEIEQMYTVTDIVKNEMMIHFGYDIEINLVIAFSHNKLEEGISLDIIIFKDKFLMVNAESYNKLYKNDLFYELFGKCDLYKELNGIYIRANKPSLSLDNDTTKFITKEFMIDRDTVCFELEIDPNGITIFENYTKHFGFLMRNNITSESVKNLIFKINNIFEIKIEMTCMHLIKDIYYIKNYTGKSIDLSILLAGFKYDETKKSLFDIDKILYPDYIRSDFNDVKYDIIKSSFDNHNIRLLLKVDNENGLSPEELKEYVLNNVDSTSDSKIMILRLVHDTGCVIYSFLCNITPENKLYTYSEVLTETNGYYSVPLGEILAIDNNPINLL